MLHTPTKVCKERQWFMRTRSCGSEPCEGLLKEWYQLLKERNYETNLLIAQENIRLKKVCLLFSSSSSSSLINLSELKI